MKKLLSLILICSSCCLSNAAGYAYRPFSCDGGSYDYRCIMSESGASLVVTVESGNLTFPPNPTLLLKTFNDQVIRLDGFNSNTATTQGAVFVSNVAVPVSNLTATAIFPITEEQINLLADGVSKVRLNILPCTHERSFKRDMIGAAIYHDYQKEKKAYDNF